MEQRIHERDVILQIQVKHDGEIYDVVMCVNQLQHQIDVMKLSTEL